MLRLGKDTDFDELFGILRRQRSKIYRDQVQSLEQFHKRFTELIHQWFTGNVFQQRLVIFIDDLDRCLPEHTIGVLEAIKVFFDQKGRVIILGLDHDIVARGIRYHYKALHEQGASTPSELV